MTSRVLISKIHCTLLANQKRVRVQCIGITDIELIIQINVSHFHTLYYSLFILTRRSSDSDGTVTYDHVPVVFTLFAAGHFLRHSRENIKSRQSEFFILNM